VIYASAPTLEQGSDQHNPQLFRQCGKFFCGRTRNRLGEIEQGRIFALAEVLRLKKVPADKLLAPRARQPQRTRSMARRRFSSGSGVADI